MSRLANLPVVSTHGLRGTHASLAVATGISSEAVAASLGHESFATTRANYARPESLSDASTSSVLDALNQSSEGRPIDRP